MVSGALRLSKRDRVLYKRRMGREYTLSLVLGKESLKHLIFRGEDGRNNSSRAS